MKGKNLSSLFLLAVCYCVGFCSLAAAEPDAARPKIGLVLKGGGALGFAHVGVLRVLERNRVPIHAVAGTSMGSIIGGAYASGVALDEMERVLSEMDWGEFFGERISRETHDYRLKAGRNREIFGEAKLGFKEGKFVMPQGVVEGQNIRPLFQELFGYLPAPTHFDSLPIPFRAVTADVETGEAYVPSQGDLATVVRASMSIPGAFSPVEIDGRLLVDGGIVNNLPVDVVLGMGADVLIVVDLQSKLATRENLQSPLSISGQMVSLLLMQNATLSRKLVRAQDIVIEPDVSAYTVSDFPKGAEIALIGERAAESMTAALQSLAIPERDYQQYAARRTHRAEARPTIHFIHLNNRSNLSDRRLKDLMTIKAGEVFDPEKVEQDIQRIYQTGYFTSAQYSLVEENGKSGLQIDAKGKDWLEQYVRLGFSLEDDLDGNNNFRLGGSYRVDTHTKKGAYFEAQGELGKQPRLSLELYEPLVEDSPYFIWPKIGIGRTPINIFTGGDVIAEYQRTEGFASLALGRAISTLGEVVFGYTRGFGELERNLGDPALNDFSYDIGDVSLGLDLDNLDQPDFPTQGFRVTVRGNAAVDTLGAPNDFQEITGALSLPLTYGRHTLLVRNGFAATFGERPIERSTSLGGFLNVSGTLQSSLAASDYNSGGLVYFHRFSEIENPFFDLAFFAGGSYELTTLHNEHPQLRNYDLINSGSVFVGADTPLLPIYIGFGIADIDEHSIYISMGRLSGVGR